MRSHVLLYHSVIRGQTPGHAQIFSPVIWETIWISRWGFYLQSRTWIPQCSLVSHFSAKLSLRSLCLPVSFVLCLPASLSTSPSAGLTSQCRYFHSPLQTLTYSCIHVYYTFSGSACAGSSFPFSIFDWEIQDLTQSFVLIPGTPSSLWKNKLRTCTVGAPLVSRSPPELLRPCRVWYFSDWHSLTLVLITIEMVSRAFGGRQTCRGADSTSHDTADLLSPKPLIWLLCGESGLNIKKNKK